MAFEAEFAEGRVEEASPLSVVTLVEVGVMGTWERMVTAWRTAAGAVSMGASSLEEEAEWLEEGAIGAEAAVKGFSGRTVDEDTV